jgi:hypothetical protein
MCVFFIHFLSSITINVARYFDGNECLSIRKKTLKKEEVLA